MGLDYPLAEEEKNAKVVQFGGNGHCIELFFFFFFFSLNKPILVLVLVLGSKCVVN